MAQIAILAGKGGAANAETTDNKVTSLSSSSTNTQYPSAKAVYDELQDIDGANVNVEVPAYVSILNTDSPALGETVYFRDYPDITWQVQHLDGDYAYLALYPMTEETEFGSSTTYSGSTIASKCTTYLNNTIPSVADYLESVTVNGVTAKVFIPSRDQLNSEWDWPKAGASNRICQLNGSNMTYWISTASDSSYVWFVGYDGNFSDRRPSNTNGFRPAVKVRYKAGTTTKDLNTAIDDINDSLQDISSNKQDKLTFDTTPTVGSTNPVTSDGVYTALQSAVSNVNPYVIGTTAPTNTSKLWIDTTATTGGLKYYNGSAWVHVPTAFTS